METFTWVRNVWYCWIKWSFESEIGVDSWGDDWAEGVVVEENNSGCWKENKEGTTFPIVSNAWKSCLIVPMRGNMAVCAAIVKNEEFKRCGHKNGWAAMCWKNVKMDEWMTILSWIWGRAGAKGVVTSSREDVVDAVGVDTFSRE